MLSCYCSLPASCLLSSSCTILYVLKYDTWIQYTVLWITFISSKSTANFTLLLVTANCSITCLSWKLHCHYNYCICYSWEKTWKWKIGEECCSNMQTKKSSCSSSCFIITLAFIRWVALKHLELLMNKLGGRSFIIHFL